MPASPLAGWRVKPSVGERNDDEKGMMVKIHWDKTSPQFRGLAGSFRRRLLIGVLITTGLTGVLIILKLLTPTLHWLYPDKAFFLGAISALICMFVGSYITLRYMKPMLIALNRLEGAKKDYLDFTDRLSHDIRSPLAAVLCYADLIADPQLCGKQQAPQDYARIISNQARQISEIIKDAMTVVEIETETGRDTMTRVDLGKFLTDLTAEAGCQMNRTVIFENQDGGSVVMGDVLRLRAAFLQLIDNGVKYSPPDCPVYVSLACNRAGDWAEVQVRDQGCGISAANQAKLFRRFGRFKNEQNRHIPGSGLGLYIAKSVVDYHYGKIAVQSRPGEGSTFTISLPLVCENHERLY